MNYKINISLFLVFSARGKRSHANKLIMMQLI